MAAGRGVGPLDKMIVRASGVETPLRMLSRYQAFDIETDEACLQGLQTRYADWMA